MRCQTQCVRVLFFLLVYTICMSSMRLRTREIPLKNYTGGRACRCTPLLFLFHSTPASPHPPAPPPGCLPARVCCACVCCACALGSSAIGAVQKCRVLTVFSMTITCACMWCACVHVCMCVCVCCVRYGCGDMAAPLIGGILIGGCFAGMRFSMHLCVRISTTGAGRGDWAYGWTPGSASLARYLSGVSTVSLAPVSLAPVP